MTAEDTLLAIGHGADAIIVPNNEGRQLDSVPSSIKVLPEIVSAVRGRVPSLLIAELRGEATYSKHWRWVRISHSWVVRHHGVSILADRKGVERVLDILERELSRTMTLVGVGCIGSIGREKLGVDKRDGFSISELSIVLLIYRWEGLRLEQRLVAMKF